MELSVYEQIFEQIKKSQKILIALPENLSADALSSGLAFWLFLNKLKKDVVVASSGNLPESLRFLPDVSAVQKQIKGGNSLVVSLDTSQKQLDEISYQTDEVQKKVRIYLKAKAAEFAAQDISFTSEKFPLDLIIVLGTQSLANLGALYEQSADLFFETPKINIDHDASNEYFGQINLVDVTATAVAEILADLLGQYEQQLFDEDIATCLLTGIIDKTSSFQHVRTTPRAFLKASELVNLGGRQQEIVRHIYKTKSLQLLKLWGRALARMKIMEDAKAVYSILALSDFEKAGASEKELLPSLKEFIDNISGYNIVALLAEPVKDGQRLLLAAHEQVPLENLLNDVGEGGRSLGINIGNYRFAELTLPRTDLEAIERNFIEAVKKHQIN